MIPGENASKRFARHRGKPVMASPRHFREREAIPVCTLYRFLPVTARRAQSSRVPRRPAAFRIETHKTGPSLGALAHGDSCGLYSHLHAQCSHPTTQCGERRDSAGSPFGTPRIKRDVRWERDAFRRFVHITLFTATDHCESFVGDLGQFVRHS